MNAVADDPVSAQPAATAGDAGRQPAPSRKKAPLRVPYDFELSSQWLEDTPKDGIAGDTNQERYYNQFLANLQIDDDGLPEADRNRLRRFVAAVHMNARWYYKAIKREQLYRAGFIVLTVALLGLIPILLVWGLPKLSGTFADTEFSAVTGQIVGVLTGLIAIHKTLQSWLNARKVIGRYWQTRTSLVDVVYDLEMGWSGSAQSAQAQGAGGAAPLTDGFRNAVAEGLGKARTALRAEMTKFFDEYQARTLDVDLAGTLAAARQGAAGLFEGLVGKRDRTLMDAYKAELATLDDLRARKAAVALCKEKIEALEHRLDETRKELAGLPADDKLSEDQKLDKERLTDLKAQIIQNLNAVETECIAAKADLAAAEAKLTA